MKNNFLISLRVFAIMVLMIAVVATIATACNPQDDDDDDDANSNTDSFYEECDDIDISIIEEAEFSYDETCKLVPTEDDVDPNDDHSFLYGNVYNFDLAVTITSVSVNTDNWDEIVVIDIEGTYIAAGEIADGIYFELELNYSGSARQNSCSANMTEIHAGQGSFHILEEYTFTDLEEWLSQDPGLYVTDGVYAPGGCTIDLFPN